MRFWDASGVCLHLLYKLSTVRVFLTDADPNDNMNTLGEDEWPPLRKVRWLLLVEAFRKPEQFLIWGIINASVKTTHCILSPRLVPSTLTVMILDLGSRRSTCVNTVDTWL